RFAARESDCMLRSTAFMYDTKIMNVSRAWLAGLIAGVVSVSCSGKKSDGGAPAPQASAKPSEAKPSEAKPSETKPAAAGREFQIAWSVWTGWMPFKLMEAKGFLAKRAADK